jgi:SAM-dependent methyltransferase
MAHVCPWWLGYLLANPLRRLVQDPHEILAPFVSPGMKVLEPGPGMGFFTLELARLVGQRGKVFAVDLQPQMLSRLRRRVARAGLAERVDARLAQEGSLGIGELEGQCDFALLFALVHEIPDLQGFFAQLASALAPGAKVLVSEPAGHVTREGFGKSLELAAECGLSVQGEPKIWRSLSAVLVRQS